MNDALVMRGRKLVLNYTDGSPCDSGVKSAHAVEDLERKRELIDDDDDKKKGDGKDLKREYQLAESEDGVWMLVAKEKGPENKERRDSLIDEVEDEG